MHPNYHLGILHLTHLLASADGKVTDEERAVLESIRAEEHIPDELVQTFMEKVQTSKELDLYLEGISLLNQCSEEEKLCAFVHLYRLAEADSAIHVREVRFLFYGIKSTKLSFDDVILASQLNNAKRN